MRPSSRSLSVSTIADAVCLLSVVVGICVVQFGLSGSLRAALVFRYGTPTLFTPWTATLVHDSVEHLTVNLLGYLAVIVPTYLLYRVWGRRRRFWLLIGSVVAVMPPLIAAADWWLLYQWWALAGPQTVGYGFSGVVSGLVGVLVASTVAAVADWYGHRAAVTSAVALVSTGIAGVLLTSGVVDLEPTKLSVGGVAVVLLAVFGTQKRLVTRWWYHSHRDHTRVVLIGTCSIVASVLLVALFQLEAAVSPRFVDVLAHVTGFLSGIVLTIISGPLNGENGVMTVIR